VRTLAITQNTTVDGAVEMLDDWFAPQGQAGVDDSDLVEEIHRQDERADALLLGRQTFEDFRSYWPGRTDDPTGISAYLDRVQKYVVSSTLTEPGWQHTTVLDGDPVEQVRALTGGRGADYVLEAAGMTAAQEQALTTARRAGTIVLTGVERLGATITYPQFELALQGRRVLSCQNGNVRMRRDLPLFVGMLEDGRLDAEPIITSRYALDEINEALSASADKRDLTGVIVPNGRS
jgi:hypothetical protein